MPNNSRRKAKGREFKPREPYTHRLRKILEEYPDGSQVLREILQNSDDAKSTEQVFILDYNTYQSNSLFEPDLVDKYDRTDLKLNRYQGPALLAKNNTIFDERDFQSLLKLADSEKRDQFDKIGVMGVGFNSIYHITDSPSFITGDKYVILDPHEWYFNGGVQFDFVDEKLAEEYPDQFVPFKIPCDRKYEGTIFRYPLRTNEDSIDSKISKKIYKLEEILDMFKMFYDNESINCLLFLKYIERISFYVLKEGATEPELLYTIQLENASQVKGQRRLIAEKIVPMMNSLNSEKLDKNRNRQLQVSYVASFSRHEGDCVDTKETSEWLILNYLDDLIEAKKYFQENFEKNISDYKFVPNVGLAVPLKDLNNVTGRLFCFLPLPINMPFRVSVHGYFAVSTNRRSLWSAADSEDLATDALARLKVTWNRYLFENVLPKAWVEFLRELPLKIDNIRPEDLYRFWPIIKDGTSGIMSNFCKDLLQNVINCLSIEDRVFEGPSSSNTIGIVSKVAAESYNASSFKESKFHWLSLSNGYLEDEKSDYDVPKIIGNIGFPVISVPRDFIRMLKQSRHKDSLSFFSPTVIRTYLDRNRAKWEDKISREEVLHLLHYILKDKKFDELVGFKMIPLADGTLGTITQSNDFHVYIGPNDHITDHKNDERNIFKDQLSKFVDNSIRSSLYKRLYDNAKAGWNLNIKILDETAVAGMIKSIIGDANSEEIQISDRREWIYELWENLKYRNWDLTKFEEVHLIPTSNSTLRKLKTQKKIFSNRTSRNHSINSLIPILKKFGGVFVEDEFDTGKVSKWDRISKYIIKLDDVISILNSFRADTSYPANLNLALKDHEASAFIEHLSNYLRLANIYHVPEVIDVIKHLPIFTEIDNTSPISLLPGNQQWFLLPRNEENSYGKIICPSNKGRFLKTCSQNLYILEEIIKITRLNGNDYWRKYVIPFLESQQPRDIDIVIDKLFDRLQSFSDQDKDVLGKTSFVPVGTFNMSKQQQMPDNVRLAKPIELFNPEEKAIVDIFFESEHVFPVGNYGISQTFSSKKFLSNLKSLGIKSALSKNDIISRIDLIVTRRKNLDIQEDLIQEKALNLFKYIDGNWDKLNIDDTQNQTNRRPNNNNNIFLKAEWIPAIDASRKIIFSNSRNCYYQRYKNLICLVSPVIDYKVKNKKLLKFLGWDTYPGVDKIITQLGLCYKGVSNKQPPENLEEICTAIYKYMGEIFGKEEFSIIKRHLKDKPWILCGKKFYPVEKVVFNLPNQFHNKESLIVELPNNLKNLEDLFKHMGVRVETGIKDLILIIKDIVEGNKNKVLSKNEINSVIQILEQIIKIQKDNKREGNDLEKLDGLLVPSKENMLVELHEIYFDDMKGGLDEDERSKYKIAHNFVTLDIAKELEIQTLTGEIYGNSYAGEIDWEMYEQNEKLTTRIKNIIEDYSINSLIKEFLQNADDAKAKCFRVTVDEREMSQHNSSLLSEEMKDWQGPAIWIYNDAEFSAKDFQSLIKLGVGGKFHDDTKIGRFGIGFNCAFHITDLPSFVSGKYIAFLDPNARYLPAQGYPPRRPRGTRINFIETEFKKNFQDQCYPYEAFGCDFSKEYKGTLFRLPLRNLKLAQQSEISDQVFKIKDILHLFNSVQSNKELLFLRNIELCDLYHLKEQTFQPKWSSQIYMPDDTCRDIRKTVTDEVQVYHMGIEIINKIDRTKMSEIWLLCTGGHESIKTDNKNNKKLLEAFSTNKRLKPRGGVAALLAQSHEKSLNELMDESFPNPPELKGEVYSYLSLSIGTNLGVHLNGNFSLSSARSNVLQSENDFIQGDSDDSKWNKYILHEVLPDLHIRLLEGIVKLEEIRHEKDRVDFIPHILNNFWPAKNLASGYYKGYGLIVIKKLGNGAHRVFWTEASGGKFISLSEGKIFEGEERLLADILTDFEVPILKLDKDKLEQFKSIAGSKRSQGFTYTSIDKQMVCDIFRQNEECIYSFMQRVNNDSPDNKKDPHESIYLLLRFILRGTDNDFNHLIGLPLVPLSDGSVGKFGNVYYIGKQKHLELFPAVGPSRFVHVDLPSDLLEIFKRKDFSVTNIKEFNTAAILDLLSLMFKDNPVELDWDPNGKSIPNTKWLDGIWSKFQSERIIEFARLSKFPLLPMIQPYEKLVRLDTTNPLLYAESDNNLYSVLTKLKLRFTNKRFPDSAHPNLKQCVLICSPMNIVSSLERTCVSLNLDMEQLFKSSNLSVKDCEKFRSFIKENESLIRLGRKLEKFMNILRSLPIWPIHSCSDRFISAESGILLPYNLPFFSFREGNFYKCDNEPDYNVLFSLNATNIDEATYVTEHLIPQFIDGTTPTPQYITFLQSILSLGNHKIEQYFEQYPVIPNKSAETLVKANTLYDSTVHLFYTVFEDTDNFLPPELCNNTTWVAALRRIGLKYQVNSKTFIECAEEIESQFQQPNKYPITVVKHRAKVVIDHLYTHFSSLRFTTDQFDQMMNIKFVPSEHLQGLLYEDARETSGFESFSALCLGKYKEVCWTQRPLFERSVEPPTGLFHLRFPEVGKPCPEDVINHWLFVVDKIKSKSLTWRSSDNYNSIKRVIKEIYEIMNEFTKQMDRAEPIRTENKLFLNGDDLFDEENWVKGSELVFGVQEDIRSGVSKKVHESLVPYESLLMLFGARKLKEVKEKITFKYKEHNQKDLLLDNLLEKLKKHPDTKHHDVIFTVGEEGTKIGANRYVLSAASKYFGKMFCGHTAESIENEQAQVRIEDIETNSFRVFLRWLYGQSFEDAKDSILRKPDNFTTEQKDYDSYYLEFLISLLKITDMYEVEPLKEIVENTIIMDKRVNFNNVCETLEWAKDCKASKLENHCEKYIESNKDIVVEKRLEFCETALNEEDREEETQILQALLESE